MIAYCADCGMPQPEKGELHLEDCIQHKIAECVVCNAGSGSGYSTRRSVVREH